MTLSFTKTGVFFLSQLWKYQWGWIRTGGTIVSHTEIQWGSAFRTLGLEIFYSNNRARKFHDEGVIKFPNGVSCKTAEEKCNHAGYGQLFWKNPFLECDSTNLPSCLCPCNPRCCARPSCDAAPTHLSHWYRDASSTLGRQEWSWLRRRRATNSSVNEAARKECKSRGRKLIIIFLKHLVYLLYRILNFVVIK